MPTRHQNERIEAMRVRFWGVRGSVPVADERMLGYGGNTPCVEVTLSDGSELILDAGTGIRGLGAARTNAKRVHLLLTHLHLDHIQGLLFFAPFFDPDVRITVWGPPAGPLGLRERLARYLSDPLSPIEIRELPARVSFRTVAEGEWQIGPARVAAALVAHRGTTLGYTIADGGRSLCYLPDHEPGLGAALRHIDRRWISGHGLARDASLLIHDAQYTEREYHDRRGWGHSSLTDALSFAQRADPGQLALFHHDPLHDDNQLDQLADQSRERWQALGHHPNSVRVVAEGEVLDLGSSGKPTLSAENNRSRRRALEFTKSPRVGSR